MSLSDLARAVKGRMVIVVNGEDQRLDAARSILVDWARAHMLEPFVWCRTGEELAISTIDASGELDCDPGTALRQAGAYTLVFLERPSGPRVGRPAETLVKDELRRAAPNTMASAVPTPVRLLVPDALDSIAGTDRDRQAASAGDDELRSDLQRMNEPIVIVVPEDRSDPADANFGVTGERYEPHVAQAIASLLGLWHSATGDVAPAVVSTAGAAGVAIAARSYSRVIEAGHLPDLLAAGAVRFDGRWPVPDPQVLKAQEGGLPLEVLDQLASSYTEKHRAVLLGEPFPEVEVTAREPVTLLVALRRIGQALIALVRAWPGQVLDQVVGAAYDRVAGIVQVAADHLTGQQIMFWDDPGEEDAAGPRDGDEVRSLIPTDGPITMAWTDMTRLSFGLVDGSSLPSGIDERALSSGGRRRIVVDLPHQIGPRPIRSGVTSTRDDNRSCDPLHLDPDLAYGAANAMGPGRLARSSRSLCWRIGRRIGGALVAARQRAEALVGELERARQRQAELDARFDARMAGLRRVLRWATLAILVAGGIVGWRVWGEPDGRLVREVLCGVGTLLVLLTVSLAIDRRQRRLVEARAEAWARASFLAHELEYQSRLAEALQRRYREYLDWADVIAELVHEPWTRASMEPPQVSAFARCRRPEASRFSVGCFTESAVAGKVAAVRYDIFDRGWLVGWFAQVVDDAMARLRGELGLDDDAGLAILDPWADRTVSEMGARRYLRRYIRSGVDRSIERSPVADQVRQAVAEVPLSALVTSVREVDDSHAGPVTASMPPDRSALVVRVRSEVGTTVSLGSGVVITGAGMILTNAHVVAGATAVEVQFADEDTWTPARVDAVSPICDLALVAPNVAQHARPAARLADRVAPGDPVTCSGYPDQVDGSAIEVAGTVAGLRQLVPIEGSVSALATFQLASSPGSSGSGILDADGRLVSILVGGTRRESASGLPDYLSVGLAHDDIREFLADVEAEGLLSLPLDPAQWVAIASEGAEAVPVAAFLEPIRGDAGSQFLPDNFRTRRSEPVHSQVLPPAMDLLTSASEVTLGAPIRFVHVRVEATAPRPLAAFHVSGLGRPAAVGSADPSTDPYGAGDGGAAPIV